jgi:hypothetical protein
VEARPRAARSLRTRLGLDREAARHARRLRPLEIFQALDTLSDLRRGPLDRLSRGTLDHPMWTSASAAAVSELWASQGPLEAPENHSASHSKSTAPARISRGPSRRSGAPLLHDISSAGVLELAGRDITAVTSPIRFAQLDRPCNSTTARPIMTRSVATWPPRPANFAPAPTCRSAWAPSGAGRRLGVEAGSTEGFFALAGEPREPALSARVGRGADHSVAVGPEVPASR